VLLCSRNVDTRLTSHSPPKQTRSSSSRCSPSFAPSPTCPRTSRPWSSARSGTSRASTLKILARNTILSIRISRRRDNEYHLGIFYHLRAGRLRGSGLTAHPPPFLVVVAPFHATSSPHLSTWVLSFPFRVPQVSRFRLDCSIRSFHPSSLAPSVKVLSIPPSLILQLSREYAVGFLHVGFRRRSRMGDEHALGHPLRTLCITFIPFLFTFPSLTLSLLFSASSNF
jgi:hypothetical protein